jgi:negative regulator of flagellin synthesis FlgM
MPNPIQGVNPAGPLEIAQTGQAGTSSGTTPANRPPVSGSLDSADVARAEALLATIAQAAATVPAIDEAQVASLRAAIQSGTYQADPQQIAEKIMELEALLVPQGGSK